MCHVYVLVTPEGTSGYDWAAGCWRRAAGEQPLDCSLGLAATSVLPPPAPVGATRAGEDPEAVTSVTTLFL